MVTEDYPEYRVFWSRSDFRGSDVFEIFPGDFSGETRWQNAGSAYVREEAFVPFNEIIRGIAPRFDWYGETRLGRRASLRLIKRLEVLARAVDRARTVADLHAAFGNERLWVDETNVLVRRAQLLKMIADFQLLAQTSVNKRTGLWLLGP
jgi:hypothetical protein